MTDERLTDQQLAAWEAEEGYIPRWGAKALVAEVRALRAQVERIAEQRDVYGVECGSYLAQLRIAFGWWEHYREETGASIDENDPEYLDFAVCREVLK